ncbi:hypothetical protein ACMFMG_004012 [Clarireedia jacksonii]
MCIVNVFTFSGCDHDCGRIYVDVRPERHCSPLWPSVKCMAQYVAPNGIPAKIPERDGSCWRCIARRNGVSEADAEASRPDRDHAYATVFDPTTNKGPTYGDVCREMRKRDRKVKEGEGGGGALMVASQGGITKARKGRPPGSGNRKPKTAKKAEEKRGLIAMPNHGSQYTNTPHHNYDGRRMTAESLQSVPRQLGAPAGFSVLPQHANHSLTGHERILDFENEMLRQAGWTTERASSDMSYNPGYGPSYNEYQLVDFSRGDTPRPYNASHFYDDILQPLPVLPINVERIAPEFHNEPSREIDSTGASGHDIYIQQQQESHDSTASQAGHILQLPMYESNADVTPADAVPAHGT